MAVLDGVLLGILLVSMLLGPGGGLVLSCSLLVGWVAGFLIAGWLPRRGGLAAAE